jgi:hypothetical protein
MANKRLTIAKLLLLEMEQKIQIIKEIIDEAREDEQ